MVLAAASPAPARGQTAVGWSCEDPQAQLEMNRCAALRFEAADARLNQAYRTAVSRADAADRARLRTAQRAWIAFRDSHCAWKSSDSEGGSLHPLLIHSCMADLTDQRTHQLQIRPR